MTNKKVIEAWRKVIEGNNEFELIKCEECGGTGFSKPGTGYDSICDNCSVKVKFQNSIEHFKEITHLTQSVRLVGD